MSNILLKLKQVYYRLRKKQSFLGVLIADKDTLTALRSRNEAVARQCQIELYRWKIEEVCCEVEACKDAGNMAEAGKLEMKIRIYAATIKEHEAWGRGDKNAVRQSVVEGLRYLADKSRLCGGSDEYHLTAIFESQACAYETGKYTNPGDPMDLYRARCGNSENQNDNLGLRAVPYVSVPSEIREDAKLLAAILQAFSGQFALGLDQDESVLDRNRVVAVCIQNFLLSKVTLYISRFSRRM
jgi:hypothetical protein